MVIFFYKINIDGASIKVNEDIYVVNSPIQRWLEKRFTALSHFLLTCISDEHDQMDPGFLIDTDYFTVCSMYLLFYNCFNAFRRQRTKTLQT